MDTGGPFTIPTAPTSCHNCCRLMTDARPCYDCRCHLDPAAYQPCHHCMPPPTLTLLPPCSTWAPIPLVLIVVACTLISYKYIIILCNHHESVLTVPWPRIDYDMTRLWGDYYITMGSIMSMGDYNCSL